MFLGLTASAVFRQSQPSRLFGQLLPFLGLTASAVFRRNIVHVSITAGGHEFLGLTASARPIENQCKNKKSAHETLFHFHELISCFSSICYNTTANKPIKQIQKQKNIRKTRIIFPKHLLSL